MQFIDFFGFLPPILFFGALIFFSNKFKGKSLTEILEKNPVLKDLMSILTQQVNPEKKGAIEKKAPLKQDFIAPPINGLEIKSSFGNLVRGFLLITLLIVAGLYLRNHWGLF